MDLREREKSLFTETDNYAEEVAVDEAVAVRWGVVWTEWVECFYFSFWLGVFLNIQNTERGREREKRRRNCNCAGKWKREWWKTFSDLVRPWDFITHHVFGSRGSHVGTAVWTFSTGVGGVQLDGTKVKWVFGSGLFGLFGAFICLKYFSLQDKEDTLGEEAGS